MAASTQQTSRTPNRWASIASLWIGLLLLIVEVLIATRLILMLVGATEGNGFVDFIYDLSGPLVRPFEGIIDEQTVGDDGIFEPEAVIALVVYPLLALLLNTIIRTVAASAPQPKADVWGTSARDLYVRISTLQNSLAASAAVPASGPTPPRVLDTVDPQIDELTTALHALELDPPNDRAGMALRNLLVSLNAVRAALRAESAVAASAPAADAAATGSVTGRMALREQLATLDASLQAFRAAI